MGLAYVIVYESVERCSGVVFLRASGPGLIKCNMAL